MPVSSNAVATVTIQDQDLLAPGLANLVQRNSAQVIFPASNAVQYGGYQVATSVVTNLIPVGSNVSFVYIRNAATSGNVLLFITLSPQSSPSSSLQIGLSPGGIFVWANTSNLFNNTFGEVAYSTLAGQTTLMEYLYAF